MTLSKLRNGPLTLVATFLIGSAAIRLLAGGGEVMARESAGNLIETAELPAVDARPNQPSDSKVLEPLLKELSEREGSVSEREAVLDERFAVLQQAEARISEQIVALETAETKLRQMLTIAETAASEDVARLTAVFQNMKPKDAAKLFEEMDPKFAAGFLAEMKPDVAAALMAGLEPETAYAISVILAGRNAGAPRE